MTAVGRLAAFVAYCSIFTSSWSEALNGNVAKEDRDPIHDPPSIYFYSFPPAFQSSTFEGNLAIGRSIDANSTCGQFTVQSYCTVENWCDICDASDPLKAHNASSLNDGEGGGKWWQSKSGEAAVTLELRLERLARFAAFSMSFKSPRPAAAVLEKSADFGRVYAPYQYYYKNCSEIGLVDTGRATGVPGQLSCTSVYSDGAIGEVSNASFEMICI